MLQVKMKNKVAENPFYGKSAMKTLLNQAKSVNSKSQMWHLLDNAWKEAKETKELREGFFVICFSIAEITNRQHNLLGKKQVDNGGNACRVQGMWILSWIRKNNPAQYYTFMFGRVINEFISFFALLAAQVRTFKGKKNINLADFETYSALAEHDLDKLSEYIATVINTGSVIDKIMLAKWLVLPRLSKRQKTDKEGNKIGSRQLQVDTIKMMNTKENFYLKLSKILHWEVIKHKNNWEFKGLKEWKKQYNQSLESVLFSTKKINTLDKEEFFKLIDGCPSGARYRIQRRLMDGDGNSKGKWINNQGIDLVTWYKEWELFKKTKQAEERILTEKVRQGQATDEDKVKLEKVKKEAKVNVGATSLFDELNLLIQNKGNELTLQSILNKVQFRVPALFIADVSSSMQGLANHIARLLTTIGMLKNPSPELDNILITFGAICDIYTDNSKVTYNTSRFLNNAQTATVDKIVDRTKDFVWNYNNVSKFIPANQGNTDFSTVARAFARWIESDPDLKQNRMEQLQQYPVIIVISDGDLNSHSTQAQSLMAFMSLMNQYGWNGVVVVWNVTTAQKSHDVFENIQNVVHYFGYNLGIVDQIFSNIDDLDVIDIYSEVKSLWLSNRYEPIKALTL